MPDNSASTITSTPNPITATITLADDADPVQVEVSGDTDPNLSPAELKSLFEETKKKLPQEILSRSAQRSGWNPWVSPRVAITKMQIKTQAGAQQLSYDLENITLLRSLNSAYNNVPLNFSPIDLAVSIFTNGNTTIAITLAFESGNFTILMDDPFEGFLKPGETKITQEQYQQVLSYIRDNREMVENRYLEEYKKPLDLKNVKGLILVKKDVPNLPEKDQATFQETRVLFEDEAVLEKVRQAFASEGNQYEDFLFFAAGLSLAQNAEVTNNSPRNNPEILAEKTPLSEEELGKIPQKTLAEKLVHVIGTATSFQKAKDKTGLYALMLETFPIPGVVRDSQIEDWKKGDEFGNSSTPGSLIKVTVASREEVKAIVLPKRDEKFFEGLRTFLGRNTHTGKKSVKVNGKDIPANELVADLEEIRNMLQMASDPNKNKQDLGKGDYGGDGDYGSVTMNEIDAIATYLGKDWKRERVMKEIIAPYITLISVYETALSSKSEI
jgi:hypothetical protein